MTAYVARVGDAAADGDLVVGLWRGNLGREERLAAKYEWFYRGCPFGAPAVELLRHEPTASWVGVAAAGPRRLVWNGRDVAAGVLVDLAVAQEHRSLGPALSLQKALLAEGHRRFELLYGFPNPKAAPVFKRVGYAQLGEATRYARVLRHRRYVEKVLPKHVPKITSVPAGMLLDLVPVARGLPAVRRLKTTWTSKVDPRMDALWASSDKGDVPLAVRDTTFLSWRFDRAPIRRTEYLLVTERRSEALRAWFACEPEETGPGAGTLHVRDFWSDDAARGIDRAPVDALLVAASLRGHATVSFEFMGPPERLAGFRAAGFVPRSKRPVFGRWRPGMEAPPSLHLTSADEDE